MSLSETTVLTGVNNVGKTTVLKDLQLLFGDSSFLSPDDLHVEKLENLNIEKKRSDKIIIDVKIIAIDGEGKRVATFPEVWEDVFEEANMRTDKEGFYVPLRVMFSVVPNLNLFLKETQVLNRWDREGYAWQDLEGKRWAIKEGCFQFHYLDAQRDIQDDLKERNSYLGRMLADVAGNYNPSQVPELVNKMRTLNSEITDKNEVFKILQESLKELHSTMGSTGKVTVSPIAWNLRDLNKNVTILYGTEENRFTMDSHGVGTRSWSSLLTFKAFICNIYQKKETQEAFLPITAIEEPEAHLNPNAQKQLYNQMNELPGLKIISTHSPYVAASAELSEIRGMYKASDVTFCGSLPIEKLSKEERRKIKQAVLMSNGELLFARAIVLVEGETEVQALPMFFQKYFGLSPFEAGITFVDAKGCGNYYPFIEMASAFHIPWYIFSDGENSTIKGLNNLLRKVSGKDEEISEQKNIFVIPKGRDFEEMLLHDGYEDAIEKSLQQLLEEEDVIDNFILEYNHKSKGRERTAQKCPNCNQYIYREIERVYDGEEGRLCAMYDVMMKNKAQLAPVLATFIIESKKVLPPLVVELFDRIKEDIGHV